MTILAVRETRMPVPPRRSGTVITIDGNEYDCWPALLRTIEAGRSYDCEIAVNQRGYPTVRKAVAIESNLPASAVASRLPVASDNGEAVYVGLVMAALIAANKLPAEQIPQYTARLRTVWRNGASEQQTESSPVRRRRPPCRNRR